MRSPKIVTPQEDPATVAARQAEQARAESSRIQETQGILNSETLRRLRRFGKPGGSVPLVAMATTANSGILSGNTGISLGGLGAGGGGGSGGGSGEFPALQAY